MLQAPAVYLPNGSANRERLQALVAISVAVAMATIDTAITNTALPTIAGDIGSDGASAIWIINAYQLVMVAALLPLASLGEIVGHRRVSIAGLFLFTAASLACGLSWSLPTLIFQSPNLRALMGSAPPERSGGASGIIAAARLLGQSIGAALVALCFTASRDAGPELALWVGSGFAAVGSAVSFLRLFPMSARSAR
jgi:MFS transporter, DHA2 family, multidrug resistance protein